MPENPAPSTPDEAGSSILRGCLARFVAGARTVAFWLAVCLPAAYLPALAAARNLLPALLAVHVAAVALGHGHSPGGATPERERDPESVRPAAD